MDVKLLLLVLCFALFTEFTSCKPTTKEGNLTFNYSCYASHELDL